MLLDWIIIGLLTITITLLFCFIFRLNSYAEALIDHLATVGQKLASQDKTLVKLAEKMKPMIESEAKKSSASDLYRDPETGLLSMKAVRANKARLKNEEFRVVDLSKED